MEIQLSPNMVYLVSLTVTFPPPRGPLAPTGTTHILLLLSLPVTIPRLHPEGTQSPLWKELAAPVRGFSPKTEHNEAVYIEHRTAGSLSAQGYAPTDNSCFNTEITYYDRN